VLHDVHGNLPTLAERFVLGGDYALERARP
jgi:hypothetical protein